MTESEAAEESVIKRNRRTLFLLIGGVASLLVPLAGLLAVRLFDARQNSAGHSAAGGVFERRQGQAGADLLKPAKTPAPLSPISPSAAPAAAPVQPPAAPISAPSGQKEAPGGSLSFVRGGQDYYQATEQPQAAPQTQAPSKEAARVPRAPAIPAAARKKKPQGKKSFVIPKLKTTSGVSDFKAGGGLDANRRDVEKLVKEAGDLPDVSGMLERIPSSGQ